MYTKALFLLLALAVTVAMVTAEYDEDFEDDGYFLEEMMEKRGRGKGKGKGKGKGQKGTWKSKYRNLNLSHICLINTINIYLIGIDVTIVLYMCKHVSKQMCKQISKRVNI